MPSRFSLKNFVVNAFFVLVLFVCSPAFAGLGASVTIASGQPTIIYPSENTHLQITLSNNNTTSAINSVAFSNSLQGTLPNGLKINGAATYTCTNPATSVTSAGAGTLTATVGTQAISLSGGSIPARANNNDGTCTIIIPVTAGSSTGGATTNTYTIANGAVTGNDGGAVANSGAVSQSINIRALALPTISKTFGSSTLYLVGASTTLTLTVTNTNSIALPNFSIADNFPTAGGQAIIKVAATPANTSVCSSGGTPATFSPSAGDVSLSATGGTVAANGTCTITVAVDAKQTNGLYNTGFLNNTILGASNFSNDIGLIPANASAQVRALSPLGITKSFAHGSLASGQSDTFSITFTNSGTSPLTINSFTDSPIDGVGNATYGLRTVGTPTMNCTGAGAAGTFARTASDFGITQTADSTIDAGGSCTITTNYTGTVQTANTPITYVNSIAEGTVGTATAGVVSQSVSASVLVYDTLNVSKSVSPANPTPGNPVRYFVTVQNWSNSAINNVVISDTLTNGQTFLTGTHGAIDYTPTVIGSGCGAVTTPAALGDSSAAITIATIPARPDSFSASSCTAVFWTMTDINATNGSAVSNGLAAGSVCYNSGAICNGGASNSTNANVTTSTLSSVKSFSPAGPLSEGTITRMTIRLNNLSANPLTSASVSDPLPTSGGSQLRIASVPNAVTTCGGSPTITAVANSTSISMNNATVPARGSSGLGSAGSCVLQVDVVGSAGSYNNIATISASEIYADGTAHVVTPITASATLVYSSSLSAIKNFLPSAISSGGKSTVTIRLNNGGDVALSGVAVTDPLPSGMTLANPVNAHTSCAGTTSFSGSAGASSISMSGADIAGNGTCDMVFDVVATGSANWVNTIPVGNITASGGVSNQVAVSGTLNFNSPVGITIAKATNPSTLTFPGQVSQLIITINNGSTAVSNLRLTDYFTADGTVPTVSNLNGMQVSATPAASTTCAGGTVLANPSGTSVSLSGASIAANASCTITLNVTSTTVGGITNFIPIGSISTAQGLTNSGQATTSLTTQANIGIIKQFTPNVIKSGERSRLRITFYNPTSQPASSLNVTDNLPSGVTVPTGANPTTICSGATVTAPTSGSVQVSGGNIVAASGGVSASCYAEIDVTASAQGDYVNTIGASALTATVGGASATNSQPTSDTLRVKNPIIVHKAIDSFTLDAGSPAPFTTGTASKAAGVSTVLTIKLDNPNSQNLTQASFTDSLPSGLVVAQTPNASTTCASGSVTAPASATSISLANATIPASGSCTVTVNVLSNISGSYTNTIAAGAITTLEGVTNEEPTSAKIIISTPPTVSKQFSPAVVGSGGKSTMTIFFGNDNSSAITLTSLFTDTLPTAPGNVLVDSVPNVSTNCPSVVTAVAGSGTISYANSGTIPAGGCSISVDVTATTSGVHTNNIPAGALQTNLGNNQQPANATLTVSSLGFVSGKVFRDNNVTPNGTFQLGTDTIISGVSIELHSGADCSGGLVDAQVTDNAGNYLFTSLNAGTYSVCETAQPSSTVNGITTAGTIVASNGSTGTAGAGSNPTPITSQIIGIVLNGNGGSGEVSGSINNNFAEVINSSISGTVFLDQNNNGVKNGADTALAGVTVELLNNSGTVIATQVTDSSGNYSFANFAPATYSLRETAQPTNTSSGLTIAGTVGNGGTAGTVTTPATVVSRINNIILPPNTASIDNNFAEIPQGRTIDGTVFLDYNNDGIQNNSDYGIGSVTLNLTGTDANGTAVTATTQTSSNGTYSFSGLPEGTYTINQASQPANTTNGTTTAGSTGGTASNPSATTSRIATIDLTGTNTLSAGNDFAEIPGNAPDLTVSKTHSPSSFGEGSNTGIFTITPHNIGALASSGTITIVDNLPTGMTVAAVATGTGWTCSGAVGASVVTCTGSSVIASSSSGNPITLRVAVANSLSGQLLTNNASISGGGEPVAFNSNNTTQDVVAISSSANVSGTVWHDTNHNRQIDNGEQKASGWTVELLLGGNVVKTATTASNGTYSMTGISPSAGYQIRFKEPNTGLIFGNSIPNEQGITPTNGVRDSGASTVNSGTNSGNPAGADLSSGDGTLNSLTLLAGDNIIEQSLPLDPAGVVYDAVTRLPVAGAVVTISGPVGFTPATHLVGGSATVTTGFDGMYQFLLTPTAPVGTYTLAFTTYPSGYRDIPSVLIPVCSSAITVGNVPNPALVQSSAAAPLASAPLHAPASCPATTAALGAGNQASTQYYLSFVINPATSANIVNNHIPLDPIRAGDIVVTKTTPLVNVNVGQLVPYTITVRNTTAATFSNIALLDTIPAGFKYKAGTSSVDGVKLEPTIVGRNLTWTGQNLLATTTKTFKMMLVVGSGVQTGEYVNTAQALNPTGLTISNVATATVRVIPDPLFDCSEIIGKVFDDKNTNGYQDEGEKGVADVRLATVNGLLVNTDADGRFHIACAAIPDADRGSNFLLKLDERTLPTGYRVTTENPRDVRITRGKMAKLNFGVSIHKVVRIDMRAEAFEANSTTLKPEWLSQLSDVPQQLKSKPSVVRVSYLATKSEDEKLARERLKSVVSTLQKSWQEKECCHPLQIEEEFLIVASKVVGGSK